MDGCWFPRRLGLTPVVRYALPLVGEERRHHLEHRDLDLLAGARPLAGEERQHHPVRGHRARGEIGDRVADLHRRPVGKPGEVHDARLALDDQVVARPARLRPRLAEARDRAVDEPGIQRVDGLPAEAEPRERAGPEVLDQHVRAREELPEDRLPRLRLEVERDALLPAVDAHEVGRLAAGEGGPGAGVVPLARLLDLDHLGAHVGEEHRGVGPREHAGQVDDAHAVEGPHGVLRRSRLAALFANAESRPVAVSARRRQKSAARPARLRVEK